MLKRLIENYIKFNRGCVYNNHKYTSAYLRKRYNQIYNRVSKLNNTFTVGILLENKIDFFLSILSCMQSNITYVPLDCSWPNKYINSIKKNCNIKTLVNKNFLLRTEKKKIVKNLNSKDNELLYIMFTSGSTGNPKGCQIPVCAYYNFVKWVINDFKTIPNNQKIILNTNFTFDVSLMEVALILTKQLHFVANDNRDTMTLLDSIHKHEVNILCIVPNNLNLLIEYNNHKKFLQTLKNIFVAGSQFQKNLLDKISKSTCLKLANIFNCYGPTEATIYCSYKRLNINNKNLLFNGNVSIGKAIKGNALKIFSLTNEKKLKNSSNGELYISGKQLMKGYNNAQNSGLLKLENKVFYPTGDLAIKKNYEFFILGRKDEVIKTSGNRVNLNAIDDILLKNKKILEAKTINIPDPIRENKIISFVVLNKNIIKYSKIKILNFIKLFLPNYYLPHDIIIMKKLPKEVSGKISKKKLFNTI